MILMSCHLFDLCWNLSDVNSSYTYNKNPILLDFDGEEFEEMILKWIFLLNRLVNKEEFICLKDNYTLSSSLILKNLWPKKENNN